MGNSYLAALITLDMEELHQFFGDILLTAKSRSELIAIFSATLELLKVQRVFMENEEDTVYLTLNMTHLREVMNNGQAGTDTDN